MPRAPKRETTAKQQTASTPETRTASKTKTRPLTGRGSGRLSGNPNPSPATRFKKGNSGGPGRGAPVDFDRVITHMVAMHNERHPDNLLDKNDLIGYVGDAAILRGKTEAVFRTMMQHVPKTTIKPIKLEDFDLTNLEEVTEKLTTMLLNGGDVASITAAMNAVQTLADIRACEAERKALERLEQ